jgi:hypothetical protein
MSVSEIAFSGAQVSGSYVTGSPVDLGWMAGHMLLAIGALIAYDVAHPRHVEVARPAPRLAARDTFAGQH